MRLFTIAFLLAAVAGQAQMIQTTVQAQDGGTREVLESIVVPLMANAAVLEHPGHRMGSSADSWRNRHLGQPAPYRARQRWQAL